MSKTNEQKEFTYEDLQSELKAIEHKVKDSGTLSVVFACCDDSPRALDKHVAGGYGSRFEESALVLNLLSSVVKDYREHVNPEASIEDFILAVDAEADRQGYDLIA